MSRHRTRRRKAARAAMEEIAQRPPRKRADAEVAHLLSILETIPEKSSHVERSVSRGR